MSAPHRVVWRPLVRVALVTLAAVALSACGSPARTATAPDLPLSAATSGATPWATLPMGILSERANTFWELFGRVTGRWVLATPPGIATNGGVLAAPSRGSSVTSGVVPSFSLGFSAVAASRAPGGTWTTGVLPAGLVAAPDALAVSRRGRRFALLSGRAGGLVSSSGSLSAWTTVASDAQISRATSPQGCDLVAPSAVAVAPGGAVVVGGGCRLDAGLPIAVLQGGTWRPASQARRQGVAVPRRLDVLRLGTTDDGVVALLVAAGPQRRAVVIASSENGVAPWVDGASLALPAGSTILSTSLGAHGEATVVVVSVSGARTAHTLAAGATAWATLPPLPSGTVDVVVGAPTQALAVDHSVLDVFDEASGAWHVAQRLQVPIEYGSSG